MSAKKSGGPLIGDNRKARHLYEYLEVIEAGIALTGPEVKSLRAGQVNFTDSYVEFRQGEAWLIGLHIAPYTNAGYVEQNADRPRKLLMHSQEIAAFAAKVEQKGLTVVPAKMYLKHGKIKVELALGPGPQAARSPYRTEAPGRNPGHAAGIERLAVFSSRIVESDGGLRVEEERPVTKACKRRVAGEDGGAGRAFSSAKKGASPRLEGP